ncbi:hypothetical protein C8C77_13711 [Halanaerobium saccharolyticum]|uniref:Uncharacterized protein n=1 Tax=Halanaerobium saccharolyticum TaxID=43595 RepID=A0A4R7YMY8_9FIRM|nr:DUF6470 family protein [Halanaerobium saccharolyticum]RAK04926.1 hypothetical protein C7958_13311 [Halanaerobium saccharolyticum]TDV98298.1 hypothetical protein C8C77_13711 [Halanaerobium saccharolyticum]TDX51236.1 hypothetical protein C7956_13611 [Halanaerobium saccharolyticum]
MLQNLDLNIDSYPSRRAMGFYKLSDSAKNFAQKGLETAQEAASFYASTGDKLSDFKNYKISDLGAEIMYSEQRELVVAYKPGPNIDFKA